MLYGKYEIETINLLDSNRKIFITIVTEKDCSINENLIPLLMDCGHAICTGCARDKVTVRCYICRKSIKIDKTLPLNLHVLGLMSSSCNRLSDLNPEIVFGESLLSQLEKMKNEG